MSVLEIKRFERPDEQRPFVSKGHADLLKFGGGTVGRGVFEPGWKWSEHVKPIAGTESCQSAHCGLVVSGRLHIKMDDGREAEAGPGDIVYCEPGHDAWVVGAEPCVMLDFAGMEHYAQPRESIREAEPTLAH